MSAQPTINGRQYTHVSLTVNINGRDYFGVSDVSYGTEREMAGVFGTGPNQVGVAAGPVKHTGSLEMYKLFAVRLRNALGNGYMEVPMIITASWRETSISELHTDVVDGFIKKDDTKSTQGADPTKETFEMHVNQITRDGLLAVMEE